ncbi:gamma-tubulin complex component 6 [Latimeria chalumnae]|uniref:Gamma-tubulin complex component 6 n=1 Tax=Latimeria chalumnae TaxID=7897 RepID=M3XKU9_LATCH|nr:PREDICTED: gamma-tubulin complex component 6 [Latimeria chalumnae]XP_005994308.1 PREDICTED: gamma-tubulin complex component 6 [Latimeria chalumnae]XP_014342869.1 PREDICTED: gamma-tubulin complex component 6 [Latimeria chalumnae]XP_014342870.1 PREDICTED: gamma-tubulin complex component 6 [Latimeria chalumnae]XP_014342871.1 PREDICTED: gamma-tubulin complex component 6 [Latimeria chalumnae]XP_014342872.1 PREDICTED: gamma-tubulin complex component 6 [Latimeria chalumnae]|eukprot:XP_005994307.1 PREDICTED: gamma-tubulin complex component 6 [Latimeria chalumnae]
MASITQLFGDLCEAHMTGLSWKVYLGKRRLSKNSFKQKLKKAAYDALFMNLFKDEVLKSLSNTCTLPVKNKILMLSFNMRVNGKGAEADKLEELVEQLEKSKTLPFTEINSVLELLVELAGTGPPQTLPRKRDYFLNNKFAGRNVKYQGYDYYDVSVFEAGLQFQVANEEWHFQDTIQRALHVMEAAPGTGLPGIGLFSQNLLVDDKFEKETRVSLFGALVHSRTYDMDIKLDLPPVPDNADLSGLAIKVPQSIDQSEDEGFQSASNLTPDSQSEPSMTPDIDLWDAVLTYEPSKWRCWERIGCPPGKQEEPYLTEAGREAFDQLYRLREGELQILNGTLLQLPQLVLLKEAELVKDVLNVLIGVVSSTFSLNQSAQAFVVRQGVYVSGSSRESMNSLLSELAECGTYYMRLSRFSLQPILDSSYNKGLVFQAFTSALRKYLQYYRACVLSTPPTLSLLTIGFLFRKLGRQLRYLSELCGIGTSVLGLNRGDSASFPTGVKLLSYLYKEALNNCSNEHYPVLLSLLRSSCDPYTRFIYDWVYSGVFRDVYGEFMIQVNEDYLHFRDKHYWTHGYVLISKDVEDCVPVFLKHIANDIYICGKTINLLKLCSPRHYICWSDIPVPRISVTFSLEELQEIEKDCAVYVSRMERIARYSSLSREEKELRTEIARQELIIQARETSEKALEAIKGRQLSVRKIFDAKKREQFQELKEQLEITQEHRAAAKQEEIDIDFSYTKELQERERRLKALEEELARKARQELIEHYSKLSEEAARRERKALWKIQRHKLETARNSFLLNDEREIQELLVKFPIGERREKLDILPTSEKQQHNTNVGLADGILSTEIVPSKSSHLDNTVNQESSKSKDALEAGDSLNLMQLEKGSISEPCTMEIGVPPPPVTEVRRPPPTDINLMPQEIPCLLNVSIEDFLPKAMQDEASIVATKENSIVDDALQEIGSNLSNVAQPGEKNIPLEGSSQQKPDEYDFNTIVRPSIQSHISQGHIKIGENVSEVQPGRPRWNVHGHASDSCIKVGEYTPDTEVSLPHVSIHGHSSDSHIKIGEYVSNVDPKRPQCNIHGHASDEHIKVGEYTSEVQSRRPRWNVHGHVSQGNIKISEYVSDIEPSRPRWNVHGHASQANIKVGEYVSDVEPSRPRWNIHGHSSQSHFQFPGLLSEFEPSKPHWSSLGHASQSSIKIGELLPNVEPGLVPHQKSSFGHSSDSTIQNLLYGGGVISIEKHSEVAKKSESCQEESKMDNALLMAPVSEPETLKADTAVAGDNDKEQYDEEKDDDIEETITQHPLSIQAVDSSEVQRARFKERNIHGHHSDSTVQKLMYGDALHHSGSIDTKLSELAKRGEEEEDVWQREQAYLKSLADRYCLEKYEDAYDVMMEQPVSHILHHIMAGPCSLPVDPSIRRATDETTVQLSELVSLSVLMKHSVTAPLVAHVSLVTKAIVNYYFVELNIEKHFEALRHFSLMEDGEFAQSLSDLLFEKLGSGQTPGELLNPLVLNSILNKALQYSIHGDSEVASNLTFALKYLPEMFKPNAPDALSCLELRYKVDWPLNIVITESCMNKYNKIFSFLLQLKQMVWTLKDVWFHLKRTALVNHASNSVQFRQLQLFRHEMQHFVKVIQGYIANQILHVTWCEFRQKLSSVGNLDEIHRTHAEYLNKAIFRGLLTEKAAPVMNIIHSIFSLILKFRTQLISQAWTYNSERQMAVHPNFAMMQQSYSTFKYYSHFLFKVVTKLVNRGYQPHLEDFLLRINFNNYYKDN